jgi:hypothetical protein
MTGLRHAMRDCDAAGPSLPPGWGAMGKNILPRNHPDNEIYIEIP